MVKKILSLTLLLVGFFSAQAQVDQPMPLNPKVVHGVLPNGMNYYIMHNEEPKNRANFYIAQKVGSTLETEAQLGLAHFLEHMAFNGSKNFPGKNMLNYLQSKGIRFGADINAYTAFDKTVYNIDNIPTTDQALMDSVLLALHDWSCALSLEDEEIDAERGVIHEEWRSRNDASTRMYTAILPQLYKEYQYTRMPIGSMDVVLNFKYQDLRDYYEKWYRPDQQGIVIVGDFDVKEMEKRVINMFAPITMPENPAERIYTPVSDNEEPIYVTFEDPELQYMMTTLSFKYDKLPLELRNTFGAYIQQLLEHIAAGMINNRLSEMAQKPDCPFVAAFVSFGQYWVSSSKGAFDITIIAKEDSEKAFRAAMTEVVRACKTGFAATELDRMKEEILAQYEKMYNEREKTSTEVLARDLIDTFTENVPNPGIEFEFEQAKALLPMLPVDAINGMMAEVITPNNQALVVTQPKIDGRVLPAKETMFGALNEIINATYEAYVDEVITDPLIEKMPKKGSIKKTIVDEKLGVTKFELSNGAVVVIKTTDYASDEILFDAISKNNLIEKFGGKYASEIKLVAAAVESSKLGSFDNVKMQKFLSGKNVSLNYEMTTNSAAITGKSTIKDLETMLQLNYLFFTDIREDKETYAATANQYKTFMANAEKNAQTAFVRELFKSMYNNNPYQNQMTVDDIDSANYDKMLEIARASLKNAADYTFVFVGNVDAKSLRPFVEQYIASLPAKGKRNIDHSAYVIPFAKGQVENVFEKEMESPVTMVGNVFTGSGIEYSIKNEIMVGFISNILDIVYTQSLREDEGGTYSPQTQSDLNKYSNEWRILYLFSTGADKRDRLSKIAYDQLVNLLKNGTNEENFKKVKDAAINQYEIQSKKNSYWLRNIASYERTGHDHITGYEEILKNITLADFNKFMQGLYNDQNRIQVVMTGVEKK